MEQSFHGASDHPTVSALSDHEFAAGIFQCTGLLSNGIFQLQAQGMAGGSYIFQGTTDFVHWTSLGTNLAPNNIFYLMDPTATNFSYRFYRMFGP